jgi:hypothetical protein
MLRRKAFFPVTKSPSVCSLFEIKFSTRGGGIHLELTRDKSYYMVAEMGVQKCLTELKLPTVFTTIYFCSQIFILL